MEEVLTTNAVDAANADKADDAADRVAFRPVLTYDLARGADRAGNDAGTPSARVVLSSSAKASFSSMTAPSFLYTVCSTG